MTLWNETKSIPISRIVIWEAYKKVLANKRAFEILINRFKQKFIK